MRSTAAFLSFSDILAAWCPESYLPGRPAPGAGPPMLNVAPISRLPDRTDGSCASALGRRNLRHLRTVSGPDAKGGLPGVGSAIA